MVSAGATSWQQGVLNFQASPPLCSQSSPLWTTAFLPLKPEVRYSRRCHQNPALLVALVALEDPALLEDLSENTHKNAVLRQYAELSSQGLLGIPNVKVTRAATRQENGTPRGVC